MKTIKKILKKIDVFGVPLTFRYKSKDKYSTSLGGFTLILFFIVVLYLGISNLNKFINKKNFTTIYYTVNIPKTDFIQLKETKAIFTLGLDCTDKGRFKVDDVLQLEARYVNYTKTKEGIYNKNKTLLSTHFCTHEDFFNKHNDSFDRLTLHKFQCLDDYSGFLSGIYSDQIFTYYELSVLAKHDTPETLDNIEEYLFENDCKLQIVYTDITIDLNNYKEPITSYLNEIFIQLNPTLFIKRNMFFMNQYLIDDDSLLGIFNILDYSFITTMYSRYEEYALYLGLNRGKTKPPDYKNYAKLYMRADTKKTDIRRTYQNLMEFYANVSSLLLGIFRVLVFLFVFINNFYAEYSFSKKIFILKEFESNNFNISKREKQIQKLKILIETHNSNDTSINSFESNITEFIPNGKIFRLPELNTYNNKRKININNDNYSIKRNNYLTQQGIADSTLNKIKNLLSNNSSERNDYKKVSNKQNSLSITFNNIIDSSNREKVYKEQYEKTNNLDVKMIKNKYYFNLCELVIISFCKCNLTSKLNLKRDINKKISNILYKKLDIVLYIKNMIFIEIMNNILLKPNVDNIAEFLCYPILSANKNEENNYNDLNKNFKENDFDTFGKQINELIQKSDLTQKEKNLIFLSHQKLLELV